MITALYFKTSLCLYILIVQHSTAHHCCFPLFDNLDNILNSAAMAPSKIHHNVKCVVLGDGYVHLAHIPITVILNNVNYFMNLTSLFYYRIYYVAF